MNVAAIAKEILSSFEAICADNPDVILELSAQGELITLSPTGLETGEKNSELGYQLVRWNKQKKLGKVFDSSTGFLLPNGALRSPDVSWISNEKWQNIPPEERQKFALVAPDFVIELMSQGDRLKDLQDQMAEYMQVGVRLGWLLNPQSKTVEVYRQGKEKEVLINPASLSGEAVLADLVLDLREIL